MNEVIIHVLGTWIGMALVAWLYKKHLQKE